MNEIKSILIFEEKRKRIMHNCVRNVVMIKFLIYRQELRVAILEDPWNAKWYAERTGRASDRP